MFQGAQLKILPHICLIRDKSAYCTSQMCALKSYVPPTMVAMVVRLKVRRATLPTSSLVQMVGKQLSKIWFAASPAGAFRKDIMIHVLYILKKTLAERVGINIE